MFNGKRLVPIHAGEALLKRVQALLAWAREAGAAACGVQSQDWGVCVGDGRSDERLMREAACETKRDSFLPTAEVGCIWVV